MKTWRLVLSVAALCASGCPSDEEDCTPTLEEWCDRHLCADHRELDKALEDVREEFSGFNTAQQCGDRVIVNFSGGFTGRSYSYEAASGELVGAASFTDLQTDDQCANQMMAAGEPTECKGEACNLLGSGYVLEIIGDACQGELAEPFIAACLADPIASIADCKECACPVCYPALLPSRYSGALTRPAEDCVREHCPDECSAL